MPQWLQRITGSNTVLKLASALSGTTSAEGLEEMTLSMIAGDDLVFADQVKPLIEWIKQTEKPDIIHLSSTLLLGIAKTLRRNFDIPIICSVQDEEVWIDSLNAKEAHIAWQSIAENTHCVDKFVTTSYYYRDMLQKRIPQISQIEVVYPGIDREKYVSEKYPTDPTIGFFYRMNYLNGLDILAEAFALLKKRNTIPRLKLRIGGGYSGHDKTFLRKVRKILAPYSDDVTIDKTYSLEEHFTFFEQISVISVPLRFNEGVGLYLCEAFAAGRPAVEPATGSFSEIVGDAGVLYEPNDAWALADALEKLLTSEALYREKVEAAKNLSVSRYSDREAAEKLVEIYRKKS